MILNLFIAKQTPCQRITYNCIRASFNNVLLPCLFPVLVQETSEHYAVWHVHIYYRVRTLHIGLWTLCLWAVTCRSLCRSLDSCDWMLHCRSGHSLDRKQGKTKLDLCTRNVTQYVHAQPTCRVCTTEQKTSISNADIFHFVSWAYDLLFWILCMLQQACHLPVWTRCCIRFPGFVSLQSNANWLNGTNRRVNHFSCLRDPAFKRNQWLG